MEDNLDFPKFNMELFEGAGWIVLFFLIVIMTDPAIDKETLNKSLEEVQEDLEKENRPD